MIEIVRRFLYDKRGGTAIEYALIATFIAVASIAAFQSVGDAVVGSMTNVKDAF
ncbi:MAG: Flp family type IVb pilin [Hyphomicrobiaceae bacterium]